MIKSGIYTITDTKSGKIYFGSSINVLYRWRRHNWELTNGIHHNKMMQRAFIKHGQEYFKYSFIEPVEDKTKLTEIEQRWLNIAKNNPSFRFFCFNHTLDTGDANLFGRKQPEYTEERRKFDSERMKGNKYAEGKSYSHTPEVRKQISERLKGTRHSEESYKKAAEKLKGRKASDETRLKLSISQNKRYSESGCNKAEGERVHLSKLTNEKVTEIRKLNSEGKTGYFLAKIYNVTNSTIYNIINRVSWKHIQ